MALALLAAAVGLDWVMQRPPAPVPSSAPATAFSAEHAYAHLQRIAGPQPTPIGSAGSDAIRDHVAATLSAVAGRVENVVATLSGYDSTGAVVLAAHYDTTFGTPGAADDKAAVAAMLETAHALTSGKPLRNDVVMVLTDGEVPGLLDARDLRLHRGPGAGAWFPSQACGARPVARPQV